MNSAIRAAQNALKLVLQVGRGTSGRLILDAGQEQEVKDALVVVQSEALATGGFTPGTPSESVDAAWLLIRHEHPDGEVDSAVLGVRDCEDWLEAGDWKAEGSLDSVHADGGTIIGWMPYAVPRAVLAKTTATN